MRRRRGAALNWRAPGPAPPAPRAAAARAGTRSARPGFPGPGRVTARGEATRARGVGRADRDTGAAPWGGGAVNSSLMLATAWAYGSRGRPATCPVFVNRGPRCLALEGQPPFGQNPAPQCLHGLPRSFTGPRFAFPLSPQHRPSLLGQTAHPRVRVRHPHLHPAPRAPPSVQRGNWVRGALPIRPSSVSTP